MGSGADWSQRGEYITKHGVTVPEANEALADAAALVMDPDPKGRSGRGVRTIGHSDTAGALITVITVTEEGTTYGVNAWPSNSTDRRNYREAQI